MILNIVKMKASIIKKILFILVLLLISIISNGQYVFFFAIWIFTTMLLFAVRKLKKWQGFLLVYLSIGISYYVGFDFVPFLPIIVPIIVTLIFSLFYSIPYLFDSFFVKKRTSFFSTWIFRCLVVLFEYAYH